MRHCCVWLATALSFLIIVGNSHDAGAGSKPSLELTRHLIGIAKLAQPSPMVTIPAGQFLLGSKQVTDDSYGNWKPFDDTELPNIESGSTIKLSMLANGRIFREGQTMALDRPGVPW